MTAGATPRSAETGPSTTGWCWASTRPRARRPAVQRMMPPAGRSGTGPGSSRLGVKALDLTSTAHAPSPQIIWALRWAVEPLHLRPGDLLRIVLDHAQHLRDRIAHHPLITREARMGAIWAPLQALASM